MYDDRPVAARYCRARSRRRDATASRQQRLQQAGRRVRGLKYESVLINRN